MSAYIINALRTPIGSFGGQLACFRAPELGARVIKDLIEGKNLDLNSYDQVIMGNVLSAGLGQAPARQAAILAGLNVSTECLTINKMCGSGLKAVMIGDNEIKSGAADIILAGGISSPDFTECQKADADLNVNGVINILDVIQLINLILN